ncbi:SEC-C domain-containing protein [Kushneria phosphatilytica]|uniref:SEC-C domain-containing protein n=1 Tax=Kushneria phosphatilytica TaxID=657387 RepID=A0A1S1NWT9_9GAMM|nr:SEC-C domain-containing protein [Kushneria phosphatilytica]OHV11836.1 zinc chelation protein SecC [Kushneria phosphatilytica]QEL11005.1 SEC-C domain-containing protein [Kushneria phosphatilytica]
MLAEWVDLLLGYASEALEVIRKDERYPTLMHWARTEGVTLVGGDLALAQALAPELWNQTPLVRENFASEPLARPEPDEPCWCDSGRRYRDCCGAVALPGPLPAHLMWMLSLRRWRGNTLRRALHFPDIPAQALLEAGIITAENGQLGRAQQILEVFFKCPDWYGMPEQSEPALELLTDLYQERGFNRKKTALLDSAIDHGPPFLRGAALERQCLMYLDSDELGNARETFLKALQTLPNAPALAWLETMLLLHEGHESEARDRASFWYRRLARRGDIDSEQLAFLGDLALNPAATLAEQMIYSEEELAAPLSDMQAMLSQLGPAPSISLAVNAEERLEYHFDDIDIAHHRAWQSVFRTTVNVDDAPGLKDDPWGHAGEWLEALSHHPDWLASPAILEELAMALTSRMGNLPWMAAPFFLPLHERLAQWLTVIERSDRDFLFAEGNNATLFRFGLALVIGLERGDRAHSHALAERLLELDESDPLGLREILLEQLLREGRNQDALHMSEAMAARQVGDEQQWLGLLIGQALALYRLERVDEAREILDRVNEVNPYILTLLSRDNPRREPEIEGTPSPGSRAEAWQYRVLMREQWLSTPGALAWLTQTLRTG